MILLGVSAATEVGDECRANKQGLQVLVIRGCISEVDGREPVFIQGGIIFSVHILAAMVGFLESLLDFLGSPLYSAMAHQSVRTSIQDSV
jgi:hypothetical protein